MRQTLPLFLLGAGLLAAGGWVLARRRKYPLAPGLPPLNLFVVPAALVSPGAVAKGNATLAAAPLPDPPAGILRRRIEIPGPDGTRLPLTLYDPAGDAGPLPCLVYLHGGGFFFADAGYIHENVMDYARLAGCRVVFVHYRTSEKAAFPAAFEDACAALRYAWDNADALGIDRARLAVGGDSAGGALAAACTQWARDCTDIRLCFQLLVYPVTDSRMQTGSIRRGRDTPCWNASLNRRMWQIYLREGDGGHPAWAAPMLADRFDGLPPAYLEVEQFDCLHDEGLAYADALEGAGVPVQRQQVAGTFHGFDVFRDAPIVRTMIETRSRALRAAFGTAEGGR